MYIFEHLTAPKAADDLMDEFETSIMPAQGISLFGQPCEG